MDYCDTDWVDDKTVLHCVTHDEPATHCAPNGDDLVCEPYAKAEGCNCCKENYGRGEKNQKLYKAAWDRLLPHEQEDLRKQIEG
jgi:hypothetical protein